jgi:uncharacterized membrane protein YhaH (DUF805 family)
MTFSQAVSSCMGKYGTFKGRATRSEFWWFMLFQLLASVAAIIINEKFLGIVQIALLLPYLAVGARRLHDIGRTGWWQLLNLTGIGLFVLLYWWVQDSDFEHNGYD